ncbi:hypothetical protein FLA_3233 [Filimonas lacunae]|nr:hypothetical protein FLA_3233 [Filimonas lacunae]
MIKPSQNEKVFYFPENLAQNQKITQTITSKHFQLATPH